jgi:hypothetical protein
MTTDIRDCNRLVHDQIAALNFIRQAGTRVFRQHANQGLRSHVIEVLPAEAVRNERRGIVRDGIRWFPRARPLRMLRIFRTRFRGRELAEREARKIKTMSRYLAPSQFAASEEFLVEYHRQGQREILLCGLQQYVEGQPLDPWSDVGLTPLVARLKTGPAPAALPSPELEAALRRHLAAFVQCVRRMIAEADNIPDLAGNRNLLLTPEGRVVLVDINNVAAVSRGDAIPLDDKGYPAVDKSVEALFRIETHLLNRPPRAGDPLFDHFLNPGRVKAAALLEQQFHGRL